MDTILVIPLIKFLQSLPPEYTSLILFIVCIVAMLLMLRLFGATGLYVYNIVAMLSANIQVLKGVNFGFSSEPIALGTIVFSTTYLCSDILTEHYGKGVATKGVWFCFVAQLLMGIFMIIAIGYPPLDLATGSAPGTEYMLQTEQAIALLFTPSLRILFASLLSFVITQLISIRIFQFLRKITKQKLLWLRSLTSTIFSATLDTSLFSFLAWKLLSPNPASMSVLFYTYILWGLVTYVLVVILSAPILYTSYLFKPRNGGVHVPKLEAYVQ